MPVLKKLQCAVQKRVDRHVSKVIEHEKRGARDAAADMRKLIVTPTLPVPIREGYTVAAWDHCQSAFAAPLVPRDVFCEFFGPEILRWIDDRPASAGRLDEYLKGSHQ